MMRTLALLSVVVATHCAEVRWIGLAKDNQWSTASNWYPAGVPGSDDDVSISNDLGEDETTVIVVQPAHVKSLIIGDLDSYKARLRVFTSLSVTANVYVTSSGTLELSTEVAGLIVPEKMAVLGTFQFTAGILIGGVTSIYGVADFGGQAAKVFYNASIFIGETAAAMSAAGSLQFMASSKIVSGGSIVSTGQNFQCIVKDDSVGNYFITNGFLWKQ